MLRDKTSQVEKQKFSKEELHQSLSVLPPTEERSAQLPEDLGVSRAAASEASVGLQPETVRASAVTVKNKAWNLRDENSEWPGELFESLNFQKSHGWGTDLSPNKHNNSQGNRRPCWD